MGIGSFMNRRPVAQGLRGRTSILIVLACLASSVHAVDIHPGEKVVVNFSFASPPTTTFGIVDFIQFGSGVSFTDFWADGRSSSVALNIYNGDVLLATKLMTSVADSCGLCTFVAPGSLGTTTATTNIDMSSIVSGTISGRVEYVPIFDSPSIYSQIQLGTDLKTGHYLGYASYAVAKPSPTIISTQVVQVVPLPAGGLLFGGALGFLGWIRRKCPV